MKETKASVVLTDDHKLFRKGMHNLLEDFHFIGEIYEAGNGIELLELLRKLNPPPDVILLDIQMPEMDGMEAQKRIRELYPRQKVIILTMEDDEQVILHMIAEGVNGYLLKNADPEELETALEKVFKSGFYFPDGFSQMVLKSALRGNSSLISETEFTEREMDVLKLICSELTTPEIAEKLNLSARTVDGYRQRLLEKSGARNTAGLVIYALKNKLISL
ncbi:MAG TPA: response regulator transcription factor [Mariniphaga anaerophila]|uniref:Response regulator transcription factor n=1 Tax=Mariniphaga anaerophila TaxID=1484053 RepID=A0A831LI92_9BACT|nr:response regulator transcription factor [Mariniphaga anaerophila]